MGASSPSDPEPDSAPDVVPALVVVAVPASAAPRTLGPQPKIHVRTSIVGLLSRDDFADHPVRPDIIRFVSVLSDRPRAAPSIPMRLPASGKWLLQILATDKRFVIGVHRREMKAIRYLGMLDRLFRVPVTTRNWNTIAAIANVLGR